jgi:hypothetical protein
MLTKDDLMEFVPYMIMGLSITMLLLTLADIVNKW